MLAAVQFTFDPATSLLGASIRLETLGLAAAVFVVLLLVALSARRSRVARVADGGGELPAARLRNDDLILMAFGALPGAVVGARLGYALIHLDYYGSDPGAIADPGQGGLGLTLAVVGGVLAAVSVARLLNVSVGRWLAAASLPVLIGLGLGKLAMAAGGSGQGSFSDASWATSYQGAGPWGSPNADIPAVPSQLLEGVVVLALALFIFVLPSVLRLRLRPWRSVMRPGLAPRRDWAALSGGRRFLTLLGVWALVRFGVAFTWRDARVLGPLGGDQLVLLVVAAVTLVGPLVASWLRRLRRAVSARRVARRARLAREEAARKEEAASAVRAAVEAEAAHQAEADPAAGEGPA